MIANMAESEVTREIEAALNKIADTTDQSGNMSKQLKKTIHKTVSTLRNLFMELKVQLEEGKTERERLENENGEANTRTIDNNTDEQEKTLATSRDRRGEHSTTPGKQVLPLTHKHALKQNNKPYSEIVSGKLDKKFTLTLKSMENHTPEDIIRTLKEKVNPTELKMGISSSGQ
jgi:hypothetical protein